MNHKTFLQKLKTVPIGEFKWVVLGQFASFFGLLVGIRLLADVLQPAGYGELSLAMTVFILGQTVFLGPLSITAQRFFVVAVDRQKQPQYFNALLILVTRIIVIFTIVSLVGFLALSVFRCNFISPVNFFLAVMFSIISGLNSLADSIQNAARHRRLVAWHQAGVQWMRFALALGCTLVFGPTCTIVLVGYICGSLLVLCSQLYFLNRLISNFWQSNIKINRYMPQLLQMNEYIWPFMSWGIFSWVQISADRWALHYFTSASVVGTYVVLYQLGYFPLVMLTQMVQQFISPILFQQVGDATDITRTKKGWLILLMVNLSVLMSGAVLTGITAIFHEEFFNFLAPAQYEHVSHLLPPMVLAGALFASGQCACLAINMGTNTRPLIGVKVGTGICGFVCSFTGAYLAGLDGVVVGCLFTSVTYYFWTVITAYRTIRLYACSGSKNRQMPLAA